MSEDANKVEDIVHFRRIISEIFIHLEHWEDDYEKEELVIWVVNTLIWTPICDSWMGGYLCGR